MKKYSKYFSFKNYLIAIFMILITLLICFYLLKWYQIKKDEKASESYLIKNNLITNQITNLDELKDIITENSSKLLLYVSYLNSSRIYNIENDYKDIFRKYDIEDIFYLFDITNIKDNNSNYKNIINNSLDINVNKFPVIIYYEDGVISSYKTIKSSKDLDKFLSKNNIEKK